MAKAKKFGAFAGVYTPSLLTILGVIMYMRLGWVVGEAGLINAVIIILLAHVISLSTGLSISSIATDKKIKAGGIYYILSRSLGLPMGGAIGITLFIGTALSISLYLVGFAENFLSLEPIRDFLGLEENKFGYQVVGTAAILVLVAIAFISTSLAIKTQFYILGAIALSIASIFMGFFINSGAQPETVIMEPSSGAIPMELIFAVFFPAVTGFTAGIAMSGDLKDPKKSIPRGTMSAIITGFIVYIALAIGIAFFVDRELLLNDNNFLSKVAWFSPLVIAGIWGATLSSALGGILGGPRILQAMSSDRIGPRLFAKGHGINNEPRNALLLIFVIAEAGILIGELNVIAGIVSMFYLASYGFINIAYYLESWASADFRPSFKINRYIGLLGFIAAFGVMFKLDMLSMFAALVIMLGIYFILKRKQLRLDFGDVWQSVWSSLMRTALEKMDNAVEVERNWLPNIILFSGGTKKRPHLLSLGKCLVGRHGVLSNFDLIENKNARALFPKKYQSLPGEISAMGVFTRRQTVKNVYDGIEMISKTYGFSGIEPNTVMLGWARQTRDPARFGDLLKTLYDLDLNVLMLGYDKRVGFGSKQKIDIWLKDKSNHGNLALTLSKLLILSDDWQNARVRVLIVNYLNEKSETIYKKMKSILDTMRIDAEIKIINNQIEKKPFYDIVEVESALTDLVFLEIPKIKASKEAEFVETTANLLDKIGTVMLIEASSSFKKLKIGIEGEEVPELTKELQKTMQDATMPEMTLPQKAELATELTGLSESFSALVNDYFNRAYLPLLNFRSEKVDLIQQAINKSFKVLHEKTAEMEMRESKQLISQLKSGLLVRIGKIIDDQIKRIPSEKEEHLEQGTNLFIKALNQVLVAIPEKVMIKYFESDLQAAPDDPFRVKAFKKRKRVFRSRKLKSTGINYGVKLKALSGTDIPVDYLETIDKTFAAFGQYNITFVLEMQKLLYATSDALSYLENYADKENLKKISKEGKKNIDIYIERLQGLNEEMKNKLSLSLISESQEILNHLTSRLERVPANFFMEPVPKKRIRRLGGSLSLLPGKWAANHNTLLKSARIESQLLLLEHRLNKIMDEALQEISRILKVQVFDQIKEVYRPQPGDDNSKHPSKRKNTPILLSLNTNHLHLNLNKLIDKAFSNINSILRQLPESIEILTEDSINEITNNQFEEVERIKLPIFHLVDYIVQNELIAPLINSTNQLVKNIHSALTKIEDAARLIKLSSQIGTDQGLESNYGAFGDVQSFIAEQNEHIERNSADIESEFKLYQKAISGNLNQVGSELHLYRLSKAAEHSSVFTTKEAKKKLRFLSIGVKKTKAFIQKQRANLWYSRSKARLLAKKITDVEQSSIAVIDQILNLKEVVSIHQENLEKLPFYYQQLFLSKYNFQAEFWFGRASELNDAKKAVARYKAGHKGSLIVTGERYSGKSFFTNYLTSEILKRESIYTVMPSGAGSTDPETFREAVGEALEMNGTLEEMMNNLPKNAVLIFDDLELWWEKSSTGNTVLEIIFNLVRTHCENILFILVADQRTYKLMNQLFSFDDFALLTVDLQPFSSKELQEIILFRHQTSGFHLSVDSILPAGLSQARQARLFNQIFKFSGGNIGGALLCWVSNIKDYKNNTIYMQSPRSPDIHVLDKLAGEIKVYLLQFLIHTRLTVEKLERVMFEPKDKIAYILNYLKRSGLIIEKAGQVYEIDRDMHTHLARFIFESYDKNE